VVVNHRAPTRQKFSASFFKKEVLVPLFFFEKKNQRTFARIQAHPPPGAV
jgi:hypothetical protein